MSSTIQIYEHGFSIEGALVVDTVSSLIAAAPEFSGASVEIDMSGTSEIDSAGLSLLVLWEGLIKKQGGDVIFKGVSPQAASLMQISGLGHMAGRKNP